jgi:hypothetical protein
VTYRLQLTPIRGPGLVLLLLLLLLLLHGLLAVMC